MEWRVPLADLAYGPDEEQAVLDVLRSRWLTMGAVTQEFENAFAEFLGVKHAVGVANGTLALHLACVALDIGPGDEVIVPSLTFVATANAVLYTGADVRFADTTSFTDLNISPAEIEKQIAPQTKAIIVVHYGGFACQMPKIMEIAAKHNLSVIEDASHAPGAALLGRNLGTWGEIGCFSFFSNKNLATGEGGMLVTNSDDIAERVRVLRSHGMTSLTWDRHKGHAYTYDVVELGYNYRFDEIRSALGLAQLRKLEANNAKRKRIARKYRSAFNHLNDLGVVVPFEKQPGDSSFHIFPVLLPNYIKRSQVIDFMKAEGVQTSIHYPPIHQFSYYCERYPDISLPVTEMVAARELTLPLYPGMHDEHVNLVVNTFIRALESLHE